MSPQRRTALVSVAAATALIAIKLAVGIASSSLGFVAEAAHSGTDLVAALLTFFAIGWALKPADAAHQYGHGKAEHLASLAEAAFLVIVSLVVGALAVARLVGWIELEVRAAWWAFVAAGVVMMIDIARTVVSYRAARRYASAALLSNALHFAADLIGTFAVLVGLIAARAGHPEGDSVAALLIAGLVVAAAARLIRRNVDVLMDRASANAVDAARAAIEALEPPVDLRRLRLREAAGRTFADVVIGVSPGAVVGQGHAAADRVEAVLERVLPVADIVVHVEPAADDEAPRERVRAAAMGVPLVREVHDLALIDTGEDGIEALLHLKLPGELPLADAHGLAEEVERTILTAIPEVTAVQTHLEPLAEEAAGRRTAEPHELELAVVEATGAAPRELRVLNTDQGLVVFVTLVVEPDTSLAAAHERASAVSRRIRETRPDIADVVVHTEP